MILRLNLMIYYIIFSTLGTTLPQVLITSHLKISSISHQFKKCNDTAIKSKKSYKCTDTLIYIYCYDENVTKVVKSFYWN